MRVVLDAEANGLIKEVTKIHCLGYCDLGTMKITVLTDYQKMIEFLSTPGLEIVAHNLIRYDLKLFKKILGVDFTGFAIDSLGLAYVLEPGRNKYGLESYGEQYNIPKPVIKDWSNLTIDDYIHRVTEDIKINTALWLDQYKYLQEIYEDEQMMNKFIRYVQFKLVCVSDQLDLGIKADINNCHKMIAEFEALKEEKINVLKSVMPKNKIYETKEYPAKPYKKDGTLSSTGEKWFNFLDAHGVDKDNREPIRYIKGLEEPNPNSTDQKKAWLYSLGWKPQHFKTNDKGEEVAQIKHKDEEKQGEVCDSIKELFEKEPALEVLEGLSILTHRISVFKGFLRDQVDGRLYQDMIGFTNTMRLQHKTLVNLPKVSKLYAEQIRASLIADEGYLLCGADLSNIESQTRNHYIYPYDPQYVATMNIKGFDSHLDIAVLAGFITKADEEFFKWKKGYRKETGVSSHTPTVEGGEKGSFGFTLDEMMNLPEEGQKDLYGKIELQRNKGKTTNFSSVYGVGAPKLSKTSGLPIEVCRKLIETYWKRNWAVKAVAESCYVKTVRGQKWLYNPISKFYYILRAEKDRFSTLNQGKSIALNKFV